MRRGKFNSTCTCWINLMVLVLVREINSTCTDYINLIVLAQVR